MVEDACTLDVLLAAGHAGAAEAVLRRAEGRLRALRAQLDGLVVVLPPAGLVSAGAVAAVAGCSVLAVRRALRSGELVGELASDGSWLVRREDAVVWLRSRGVDLSP